jgi:hypothetical protein
MRDRPDGPTLRALAEAASAAEDAALVARCLAIAAREAAAGDAPLSAAQAELAALCGEGGLPDLWRRLAADIRAGLFDAPGERRDAVLRLLWATTIARLRESNPEFLAASGIV